MAKKKKIKWKYFKKSEMWIGNDGLSIYDPNMRGHDVSLFPLGDSGALPFKRIKDAKACAQLIHNG